MSDSETSLRLERSIDVIVVTFAGTVLVPQQMDDTIAVLTALVEHGGELSTHELASHLLGPGRSSIAAQLLHSANGLDLVQPTVGSRWAITSAGVDALALSRILVPRESVWQARFFNDPLTGEIALDLKETETPNLYPSVTRSPRTQSLGSPPKSLVQRIGIPYDGVLASAAQPVITNVAGDRSEMETLPAAGRISWQPSSRVLTVTVDRTSGSCRPPLVNGNHVCASIAGSVRKGRWNATEEQLELSCDDVGDSELKGGYTSLVGVNIELPRYGRFEVDWRSIRIAPMDDDEARRWQMRCIESSVETYVTQSVWNEILDEVPIYAPSAPKPTRSEVAGRARQRVGSARKPQRFWHLQAPTDWEL